MHFQDSQEPDGFQTLLWKSSMIKVLSLKNDISLSIKLFLMLTEVCMIRDEFRMLLKLQFSS